MDLRTFSKWHIFLRTFPLIFYNGNPVTIFFTPEICELFSIWYLYLRTFSIFTVHLSLFFIPASKIATEITNRFFEKNFCSPLISWKTARWRNTPFIYELLLPLKFLVNACFFHSATSIYVLLGDFTPFIFNHIIQKMKCNEYVANNSWQVWFLWNSTPPLAS